MSLPVIAEGGTLSAALLGLIQGLTEFLPVSSSGHLVLFQQFLEVSGDDVLFDLILHLGTLLPVLFFYRKEVETIWLDLFVGKGAFLQRPGVRMLGLLVLATIPTGIIGLTLEDHFESLFSRPAALAITFTITGFLLFSTRFFGSGGDSIAKMKPWQALVLGVAQGAAITPGISRSGTTIAVALFLGLKREDAARFSFLMSVPAILGAVLVKLVKLDQAAMGSLDPMSFLVGFVVALVSGYFALVLLVGLVKRGGLPYFALYCWLAAIAAYVISTF